MKTCELLPCCFLYHCRSISPSGGLKIPHRLEQALYWTYIQWRAQELNIPTDTPEDWGSKAPSSSLLLRLRGNEERCPAFALDQSLPQEHFMGSVIQGRT